eukprot:TRINITY_DN5113_c1_g1_i1.p1 TRINITY_DN5113_c1_g1~~TRINITY_DN5113_c1_g1_i1.p1  ORF type:complete len:1731 (+),score=460.14 TRINITY_DN5113_c1_g1_i1:47-5239(+)
MLASRRVASRPRRENGGAVPPYREQSAQRSPSRDSISPSGKKEAVYVCPRFAPSRDTGTALDFNVDKGELTINHHTETQDGKQDIEKRRYKFAHVFDTDTSETTIFENLWEQSRDKISSGYNSTILCYGQTGSGKTHTVSNLLPRLTDACFEWMEEEQSDPAITFKAEVSYLQIYMDSVYDLLGGSKEAKRGEILNHKGKTLDALPKNYVGVSSSSEITSLVKTGDKWRATNAHALNDRSSRSHTLFFFTMSKTNSKTQLCTQSTLLVVDLAGSERVHKTKATGDTFEEGRAINKALTTLGRVMEGLSKSDKSIPYRENILTMYLKETLTNSFFALVCCCSSDGRDADETRCTLKFGSVAKQIQITRKTNELLKARIQAKERKAVFEQTITDLNAQHQQEKEDIQQKFATLSAEARHEANQRRKLEQTLNYSEAERKELLTSLQTLERDSSYLQSLVSTLQQESKRKDALLSELSQEAKSKEESMINELSTLRVTHTDLRNQLTEAFQQTKESEELKKANVTLQSDNAALEEAKKTLEANASMLEIHLGEANRDREEQQKTRKSLTKSIAQLQDTLKEREEESEQLRHTQQNLQKELQQAQSSIGIEQETVNTLKNSIAQRELDSKALRTTLTNLSDELLKKEQELNQVEQAIGEERVCKNNLQMKVIEYADMKVELEEAVQKKELAISELVESQQRLHERVTDLQATCDEKEEVEKQLKQVQQEHDKISAEIVSQKKTFVENTNILEDYIEKMEQTQSSLQAKLQQTETMREEEVTNLQTAYDEISLLIEKEKHRYEAETTRLHRHINTLEDTQQDLEAMVTKLTDGQTTAKATVASLRAEITTIQNERITQESNYKEHTAYLEGLVDKLQSQHSEATTKLEILKTQTSEAQKLEKQKFADETSALELELSQLQISLQEATENQKRSRRDYDQKCIAHAKRLADLELQISNLKDDKNSAEKMTNSIITKHNKEADELKSVIQSLKNEHSQSQLQLDHFRDQFSSTKAQIGQLQVQKEAESTHLNDVITNLQNDCLRLEALITSVEEEKSAQIKKLSSEKDQVTKTAAHYASEREALKQTQSKLEDLVSQARTDKELAQRECREHIEEKKELVAAQKELQIIFDLLQDDYNKTKKDALDIHELYMDLEVQLASEGDEKSKLEATAYDLSKQLEAVSQAKLQVEDKVEVLTDMTSHLSEKLEVAAKARDAAIYQIDTLNAVLADLKAKCSNQQEESEEAKRRELQLQSRVAASEKTLECKLIECNVISEELAQQTSLLESSALLSAEEKLHLQEEIQSTKDQLKAAQQTASKMENELSILLDRHEAAVAMSEAQSRRCGQLSAECVSGNKELEEARRSLYELEKSNKRIQQAHNRLIRTTADLRASEPEIHKLQSYKVTNAKLEQKVASLANTNKSLVETSKISKTEANILQREVKEKDRQIAEMKFKLQQAQRTNNDLKHTTDAKIALLERNVAQLSNTVDGQNKCISGYAGKIKESERDGHILKSMVGQQVSHHFQKKGTGLGIGQRFAESPEEQFLRSRSESRRSPSESSFYSSCVRVGSSPQPSPGRSVSSMKHLGPYCPNYFGKSQTQIHAMPQRSPTRTPSPNFGSSYRSVRSSGYGRPVQRSLSPATSTFGISQTLLSGQKKTPNRRTASPVGFGLTSMSSITSKRSSGYGRPVPKNTRSISPEVRIPLPSRSSKTETFSMSRDCSPVFVSRVPSRVRSRSPKC